jgi:hypothetical protein
MNAVDFIPSIVAFAAALVALVGKPKWDSKKRGIRRLTVTGRLTLVLATIALFSSFGLTWRAQQAADLRRSQQEKITRVAHTELRLALQDLSGWFVEVLWQAKLDTVRPGYEGPHTSGLIFPQCMLNDGDRALIAAKLKVQPGWKDRIKSSAITASGNIDRTLQIYAAYLNSEVLAAVSALRHSEFLFRIQRIEEQPMLDVSPGERSHFPPDAFGYERFWKLVVQLDEILLRDTTNNRVWGPEHPRMQALSKP